MDTKPENVTSKICKICNENKPLDKFYSKSSSCRDCHNFKRREKYKNDEEHRKKLIKKATNHKHEKVIKRQQLKMEEQEKIGMNNKVCKYCETIKHKERFRHNRLKCKDCERDNPIEKFKRYVRTRIYTGLKSFNTKKTDHTIHYLGCSSEFYYNWITSYTENCSIDNYGSEWHIDHVIPLSKFNLENEEEQLVAFNWRNTMPLPCKENLSKNNKILQSQLKPHYDYVLKYHKINNIQLPQEIIDLFAKHLDAGSPLEPC
jgi:hypothetical protein